MTDVLNTLIGNSFMPLRVVIGRKIRSHFPNYVKIDTKRIISVETKQGKFYYSPALQGFPDVFEQVEDYRIDDFGPDDVVIDLGANIGAFTVPVAKKVAHVYAVEPLFYRELEANVKLNGLDNVTVLPYALGSGEDFEVSFCGETRVCKSLKYSDLVGLCGMQPNVLKTDCEGGEYAMLPEEFTPYDKIEGEFHSFDYTGTKREPEKYLDMFKSLGYEYGYKSAGDQLMISARRNV